MHKPITHTKKLTPITACGATDTQEYKSVSCVLLISMTVCHLAGPTHTTPRLTLAQTHCND